MASRTAPRARGSNTESARRSGTRPWPSRGPRGSRAEDLEDLLPVAVERRDEAALLLQRPDDGARGFSLKLPAGRHVRHLAGERIDLQLGVLGRELVEAFVADHQI